MVNSNNTHHFLFADLVTNFCKILQSKRSTNQHNLKEENITFQFKLLKQAIEIKYRPSHWLFFQAKNNFQDSRFLLYQQCHTNGSTIMTKINFSMGDGGFCYQSLAMSRIWRNDGCRILAVRHHCYAQ